MAAKSVSFDEYICTEKKNMEKSWNFYSMYLTPYKMMNCKGNSKLCYKSSFEETIFWLWNACDVCAYDHCTKVGSKGFTASLQLSILEMHLRPKKKKGLSQKPARSAMWNPS